MINILVIGENSWEIPDRTDTNVYCKKNPADVNLYSNECRTLFMLDDNNNWIIVDCVIWRCQFCDSYSIEHKILDLISYTRTKCINCASTNIIFGHNIAMLQAMIECGIPTNPRRYMIGDRSTVFVRTEYDIEVFKVGDFHSGYAKSIIRNKEILQDTIDMACLLKDIQSLEPYIDYERDIRVLKVGNIFGVFERIPSMWKANVCPLALNEISISSIPSEIIEYTKSLSKYVNADIIGVDWIEDKTGEWYALEANLAPGIEKKDYFKEIASLL